MNLETLIEAACEDYSYKLVLEYSSHSPSDRKYTLTLSMYDVKDIVACIVACGETQARAEDTLRKMLLDRIIAKRRELLEEISHREVNLANARGRVGEYETIIQCAKDELGVA